MITDSLLKLETYLRTVPKAFKAIPAAELHFKPAPKKWSKKELLGHLIDSATNNWQRFVDIQDAEQPFVLRPYSQDELVIRNAYQAQSTEAVAGLWEQLNRQILMVCQQLTPEQLQLEIAEVIWTRFHEGQNNLEWLINDYVAHMEYHFRQLFGSLEVLQPQVAPPLSVAYAAKQLEQAQDQAFVLLKKHGSMSVELYAPKKVDLQSPHLQDELYVVISGNGIFFNNGERHPFGPGDVLFVPAGYEHRFEGFSENFQTWVIFYGPKGGETPHTPIEINRQINDSTYTISSDPERLDSSAIFDYLSQSYWAKDRPRNIVEQALRHCFCLGLYHQDQQIGLARVITDQSTFAYLSDVYVLDSHRGKGLGKWLVETALEQSPAQGVNTWLLHTHDAHGLYSQYGFELVPRPDQVMSRKKHSYESSSDS